MEDGGRPPYSCGNGQQRGHHPRPFFYVQPPSQPYYIHQHWQMNNPYHHYGLPTGVKLEDLCIRFHFGRPYMTPYQYMPYPGFVVPHSPLYPMDSRRMFEPRFYAPAWNDVLRPPHHQQSHTRRETVSCEVQTDPSDGISNLLDSLDKIQATERELDSGMASQSSGMSSVEEKKAQEQGDANLVSAVPDATRLESPTAAFSDSTTAVYDAESSHRSLDASSPQACWSGSLEVELPLDSSSLHEDGPDPEHPASLEFFLACDKSQVTDIQSDIPVADHSTPKCDADDTVKRADAVGPPSPSLSSGKLKDEKSGCKTLSQVDTDYKILQMPLEGVFTSEAGSHVSPLASPPYYYHRHSLSMQSTHERMSVLSPSLDELSSRDEMFSTDLEDGDLFPRQAYTGGRLAEVAEHVWLPSPKRLMCACCGKNLPKGSGRSKGHAVKAYRDEAADSEEDVRYARVPPRKHFTPRKLFLGPQRQPAKFWYKRSPYKEPADSPDPDQGYDGKPVEMSGGELQCGTCGDRFCREEHGVPEQSKRANGGGGGGGVPRRWQASPVQRQESSAPRKAMAHQRHRDDDDDNGRNDDDKELPSSHRDRGALAREPK
ncbi:bucky ball-like isoform X1 [Hippocampus zosterae]|uniref:bucky ball-like isoform X1 n=1 Tax=Hippocampus zosterae TaxID=109293 RepID=UPI00223D31B2|nr:bucky ball-like isoform X1 [Hippocampus zosterae]